MKSKLKEKFKRKEFNNKLGECKNCPFLEIKDMDKEQVYCFFRINKDDKCVLKFIEEMRK